MKLVRFRDEKSFEFLKHICAKLCTIAKEDEFVKQLIFDKMFPEIKIYSSAPNILGKENIPVFDRFSNYILVNYRVEQIALVLQPMLPPSLKSASYSEELYRQLAMIPPGRFPM